MALYFLYEKTLQDLLKFVTKVYLFITGFALNYIVLLRCQSPKKRNFGKLRFFNAVSGPEKACVQSDEIFFSKKMH